MRATRVIGSGAVLAAVLLAACASPDVKRKAAIDGFIEKTSGEFHNERGDLLITPVVSRMIAYDTLYLEKRESATGAVTSRLVSIEYNAKAEKVMQRAFAFTTEGQWRNLRENPELFTALLPKDVKPAGTCNIEMATDGNSVSYSCSGSEPETFKRKH